MTTKSDYPNPVIWNKETRQQAWDRLSASSTKGKELDVLIIGGGITGAGLFLESARAGYRTALVDARDFASGTSSRSSKLVHGGLRYLKNLELKMVLDSVTEREHLLTQASGLVNPLQVLFLSYYGDQIPGWVMGLGIAVYGLMARKWQYKRFTPKELGDRYPFISMDQLACGFPYYDAQTDDARLTLRVIQEGAKAGGIALNYVKATNLLRSQVGTVVGAALQDESALNTPPNAEVEARIVVNAAGAWADGLRSRLKLTPRLRLLQGSHLIFPKDKFPLPHSFSIYHPCDGRPVFAFPWEDVTILGTTDVDTKGELPNEPRISPIETEYLLDWTRVAFTSFHLDEYDAIASFAGIRPVINTGKPDPSKESREHAIWFEDGLLTITGGKLTTFRVMARDGLRYIREHIGRGSLLLSPKAKKIFTCSGFQLLLANGNSQANEFQHRVRRFGMEGAQEIISMAGDEEDLIGHSSYTVTEILYIIRNEGVIHLDDLMLRRTRIGLTFPDGGVSHLPIIQPIAMAELGWDQTQWEREVVRYKKLWDEAHKP